MHASKKMYPRLLYLDIEIVVLGGCKDLTQICCIGKDLNSEMILQHIVVDANHRFVQLKGLEWQLVRPFPLKFLFFFRCLHVFDNLFDLKLQWTLCDGHSVSFRFYFADWRALRPKLTPAASRKKMELVFAWFWLCLLLVGLCLVFLFVFWIHLLDSF